MGYRNVNRALTTPADPPLAHLLLVAMSAAAPDPPKGNPNVPIRYFGSVDWLVLVARSDKRYVRRSIRALEDSGWIKPDGYERGKRAWLLLLPGLA
jgi:hypothetical protein